MKVAISVTKAGEGAGLEMRFGRCPYFTVYNSETKEYEWFENSGIKAASGAGTGAAQALLDRGAKDRSGRVGPQRPVALVAAPRFTEVHCAQAQT